MFFGLIQPMLYKKKGYRKYFFFDSWAMLSFDSLDVFWEYTKILFVHNGLKYRLSEYSEYTQCGGRENDSN